MLKYKDVQMDCGKMGWNNMSFRQKLRKYLGNHAETREEHSDPTLKTRYYKTTKDRGLETLEKLIKHSQKYQMNSLSKEHGEMSVLISKGKKAFIVITVIMVKPFQTAIDFSVSTESVFPFDFGYSTKVINDLYTLIEKELTPAE